MLRSIRPWMIVLAVAAASPAVAAQNVPLSHGRYCGVGNSQTGKAPVDELDRACMVHDECTGNSSAKAPCACHQELSRAATAVAENPETSEVVRRLARNIARTILVAPCEKGSEQGGAGSTGQPKPDSDDDD